MPYDPMQAAFLQHLRQQNAKIASTCHYCKKQSIGINADKYRVLYVCEEHYIPDNPNVVHRVYPDGLEIPKDMMNPNIGGWFGKANDE